MALRIRNLFGMLTVSASLLVLKGALVSETSQPRGVRLLLPHSCSDNELMNLGDGREILVRYRLDHSSLVNSKLMLVESDLRREIAAEMSTRQEKAIIFTADERLPYRDVIDLLSDLQRDEPELHILLATKKQVAFLEHPDSQHLQMLCMDWSNHVHP